MTDYALTLSDVTCGFRYGPRSSGLSGVSLALLPGEVAGIVGPALMDASLEEIADPLTGRLALLLPSRGVGLSFAYQIGFLLLLRTVVRQ